MTGQVGEAPSPGDTPIEPSNTDGDQGTSYITTGDAAVELFNPEDFTYPEELNREHDTFKQFTEYAKEMGMTKAQATRLIGVHAEAVKATTEAIFDAWKNQQSAWVDEIKKDPEIGNIAEVRQTFAALADNPKFSDAKFKEALDSTGAGNHPAVVRTLYRWAKALSEGASIAGDPAGRDAQGQTTAPRSPGAAMYGPSGPHTGGPKMS
jgi:hypothetical protein